ncbi:MAG: hypothetical protein SWH78_14835 [Thermodesulfobacteriota bacterium]|nr:hypothetical protein [Thermodesulfobacteriota bacterium]
MPSNSSKGLPLLKEAQRISPQVGFAMSLRDFPQKPLTYLHELVKYLRENKSRITTPAVMDFYGRAREYLLKMGIVERSI